MLKWIVSLLVLGAGLACFGATTGKAHATPACGPGLVLWTTPPFGCHAVCPPHNQAIAGVCHYRCPPGLVFANGGCWPRWRVLPGMHLGLRPLYSPRVLMRMPVRGR